MSPDEAKAFLKEHGIVLEAGKCRKKLPNVVEQVAGEPIRGSWWGHEKGEEIFAATRAIREDDDTLVCRLIEKKITFIHRRLWPAIVRMVDELGTEHLGMIHEVHSGNSGTHTVNEMPFPDWVPEDVWEQVERLSKDEAREQLSMIL